MMSDTDLIHHCYGMGYSDGEVGAFYDGYEKGRADERAKVLNEVKELIKTKLVDNLALSNATKYGNGNAEQQANSYATVMKYEIADCVDDLLDDLEQLEEPENEHTTI